MLELDQRLPVFHRTVKLDAALWRAVKAQAKGSGISIRCVVDEALDAELPRLVTALNQLGLTGEDRGDKLVRLPVDDNVVGRINSARRSTGIPAVQLLLMCLHNHVGTDSAAGCTRDPARVSARQIPQD